MMLLLKEAEPQADMYHGSIPPAVVLVVAFKLLMNLRVIIPLDIENTKSI